MRQHASPLCVCALPYTNSVQKRFSKEEDGDSLASLKEAAAWPDDDWNGRTAVVVVKEDQKKDGESLRLRLGRGSDSVVD